MQSSAPNHVEDSESVVLDSKYVNDVRRMKSAARIPRMVTPRELSQSTLMLMALGATGKKIYEGTVPPAVVEKRRARNKAARAARRVHRR